MSVVIQQNMTGMIAQLGIMIREQLPSNKDRVEMEQTVQKMLKSLKQLEKTIP